MRNSLITLHNGTKDTPIDTLERSIMNDTFHQYLPELISFFRDVAAGYVLYRITKNGPQEHLPPKPLQGQEASAEVTKDAA